MELLAGSITTIFGLYLISLLIITLLNKERAINYFSSFASSAKAHFFEQVLRLTVGISVLFFSESMLYSKGFEIFGWIVIISTIILILTPWTWHHKFGK